MSELRGLALGSGRLGLLEEEVVSSVSWNNGMLRKMRLGYQLRQMLHCPVHAGTIKAMEGRASFPFFGLSCDFSDGS